MMTAAKLAALGYFPKPELVAAKWFMRIEKSPTVAMLREIGVLIGQTDLPEEIKAFAREMYAARMKQLKQETA